MQSVLFRPVLESTSDVSSPTTVAHPHSPNAALPNLADTIEKYLQALNSIYRDPTDELETISMFENYEKKLVKIDMKINNYREQLRKSKL